MVDPTVAGPKGERRALIVGVQKYVDATVPARPGTCQALRQIARLLADAGRGDFTVELLLDDEPTDDRRPLLANILAGLEWLKQGKEALLILSGRVRAGRFLPRDARTAILSRTSLALGEIAAALPRNSSVIIDAPVDTGAFASVSWVVAAGPRDAVESFPHARGPTAFLATVLRALSGETVLQEGVDAAAARGVDDTIGSEVDDLVTLRRVADFVVASAPPAWRRGESDVALTRLSRSVAACARCAKTISDPAAIYCPSCGHTRGKSELLDGGRYRLVQLIGSGGMGQVYLAEDTRMKVLRAIKVLSLPAHLSPEERKAMEARLIQEARAAQTLGTRSSHVVRVFDVGHSEERGEPFLVMELLKGKTLAARLAEGRMTWRASVQLGKTIAQTLAIAHEQGIIHRDLKPDNIFLQERSPQEPEFVKLLDFGLAKTGDAEIRTQEGRIMGTLQYMPPEQLRGERVDGKADIFSMGAVIYECLTGDRAIPGKSQGELFRVLLETGVLSIRELRPDLPEALLSIIDRCLSLDARHRPDADEVVRVLTDVEAEESARGSGQPPPVVEPPRRVMERVAFDFPSSSIDFPDREPPAESPPSKRGMARVKGAVARINGALALGGAALLLLLIGLLTGPLDRDEPAEVAAAAVVTGPGLPGVAVLTHGPAGDAGASAIVVHPIAKAPDAGLEPMPLPDAVAEARLEGADLIYSGGTEAERWARLVVDTTLSRLDPPVPDVAALNRWNRSPVAVRRFLARRVDSTLGERRPTELLFVRRERYDHERARAKVESRSLPGLGALFHGGLGYEAEPAFERVQCGAAEPGDRVFTAEWSTPGYGGDRCEGLACVAGLARSLLNAREAGEVMTLRLGLGRLEADGVLSRFETRCRVSAGR